MINKSNETYFKWLITSNLKSQSNLSQQAGVIVIKNGTIFGVSSSHCGIWWKWSIRFGTMTKKTISIFDIRTGCSKKVIFIQNMHEPTFVPKIKVIYIKIEMNKKMAGQYWIDHYVDLCYEGQSKIKRRKSIKMNWFFDLFILKTH